MFCNKLLKDTLEIQYARIFQNCMWTLRPPSDDRTGIVIEFINRFSIESLVDVCLDAVHVGTSPGIYVLA